MKQFLVTATLAAASISSAASGREVILQNFDQPIASGFILIQPGVQAPPSRRDDPTDTGPHSALFAAFSSLSGEPLPVETGFVSRTEHFPTPRAIADSPVPAVCAARDYRPRHGLRPHEELSRARYFTQMTQAACRAGVPVDLFDALIVQESRYDPAARSSKGASGLTQLMPGTASQLGVWDRWDIQQNLDGGARYLRQQLDSFGNWALALSAYNAGPGNVQKHRGIPPFKETRAYVRNILASIEQDQRSPALMGAAERDPVPPQGVTPHVQLIAFSQ